MSVGLLLPATSPGQGAPLSPASIWLLDMTDKKTGRILWFAPDAFYVNPEGSTLFV